MILWGIFCGGNPFFGAQRKGFPHTPFLKKDNVEVVGIFVGVDY